MKTLLVGVLLLLFALGVRICVSVVVGVVLLVWCAVCSPGWRSRVVSWLVWPCTSVLTVPWLGRCACVAEALLFAVGFGCAACRSVCGRCGMFGSFRSVRSVVVSV